MKVALAKQMHDIDDAAINDFGLPELVLMESAGHRVAKAAEKINAMPTKRNVGCNRMLPMFFLFSILMEIYG